MNSSQKLQSYAKTTFTQRPMTKHLQCQPQKQAQHLLWEEQQREVAQLVCGVLRCSQNADSVDWIEVEAGLAVEKTDPILIWHSNKDTVEAKIMENKEKWFQLMESTLPMNKPLLSDLGFLADTNAAK